MKFNFKFKLKPDKKTVIIAVIAAAFVIPSVIFCLRSPVLIVTELSFTEIYGKERLQNESFFVSLALFRPVKLVVVANDAGEDVVPFAITQASIKPYCVLFPLRFAGSARLYKNLGLNVPIVVLEGRCLEEENPAESILGGENSDYFIFKTDINDDFYRIGLVVTAIKPKIVKKQEESTGEDDKKGKVIVFLDYKLDKMKDVFLHGLYDRGELYETHFFNSFSQYMGFTDLHCVVMAGVGAEFLEKKAEFPVLMFTWLDPVLLPFDVVMTVNDSPLAQVRRAVKMVGSGVKRGAIKSEFRVLNKAKFSKKVIAIIKKNR